MEWALLCTQGFDGENGQKYIKVFDGDEPDGKTEHGLSIIGMAAEDYAAEAIFAAGTRFEPLQLVRITFDVARGGQNKGKNLALHIEAVATKATRAAAPQATTQQQDTPADPAQA